MNMTLTSAITAFFVTSAAFAQEVAPQAPVDIKPITITKTKISCTVDRIEKISDTKGGPVRELVTTGKASESIRTTWKSGDVEYHFSDATGFRNDGKEVAVIMKSIIKTVTKKENNQVFETSQVRQVLNYFTNLEIQGGNLQHREFETVSIYQLYGSDKVLISSTYDGKSAPTFGLRETEIKLNDTQKKVFITHSTPYIIDEGDIKIEVIKAEQTCLFEDIK